MTKKKLEPGDRVMVRELGCKFKGTVHSVGTRYVNVVDDHSGACRPYYHKQCRRLKPVAPKPVERERRRFWMFDGSSMVYLDYDEALADAKDYGYSPLREYVYLLPSERVISKEELAEAWDTVVAASAVCDVSKAGQPADYHYRSFCEALGFKDTGGNGGEK